MQGNKALSTIVAVIAVMIVISAVAIPVFSSMSDSVYATEENDVAYYRMSLGDSSAYLKIEVTDEASVFIVNGETVDTSRIGSVYYAISDAVMVGVYQSISIYGDIGLSKGFYALSTAGSWLEFADGSITAYVASADTTYDLGTYSMLFYLDDEGDWTLNRWTYQWVDDGATVYVANSTVISYEDGTAANQYSLLAVTDGVTEAITSDLYDNETSSWTTSDPTDVTVLTRETGDLASYITPVSYMIGDQTMGANSTWISPYTYKVITDEQKTLLSLVDVIPLLIVVMVLIVAAYGIIRAREE